MDLAEGDERPIAGLEELLDGVRPRLERMVALRMHPGLRGRFDPADVVQDALAEVLRRGRRPPDMDPYLWLRLEVGERLIDLHRKHLGTQRRDLQREQPAIPEASSFAIANALLDSGSTPSQHGMRREHETLLQEALDRVKPIDREVIVLRHFEEVSNVETARLLGLSEQAASVRYVRALQRLRGLLDRLDLDSAAGA